MLAGGALLGLLLTLLLYRKNLSDALNVCLAVIPGALLGGHLFWSLISLGKLPDYATGYGLMWQPQLGGYSLAGAIIGGLIALLIVSLITRKPWLTLLDMATPGSLLAIFIGRTA